MSFVARKTTFPGADYCLPIVIGIRVIVGVANADDLMRFWIRYVENAVQRTQSDVITIRYSGCTEKREKINLKQNFLDERKRVKSYIKLSLKQNRHVL